MSRCETRAFSKSLRIKEMECWFQEQRVVGIDAPVETGSATKFRGKSEPFLAHCVWFRDLARAAYSRPLSDAKLQLTQLLLTLYHAVYYTYYTSFQRIIKLRFGNVRFCMCSISVRINSDFSLNSFILSVCVIESSRFLWVTQTYSNFATNYLYFAKEHILLFSDITLAATLAVISNNTIAVKKVKDSFLDRNLF